jgi:ribonucleotide reductase beta subunit family protein with ferritin-like domain
MSFDITAADKRLTTYPINRDNFWRLYKRALACFWTAEEIDLFRDLTDFQKLQPGEKRVIEYILAFFAGSDKLVNNNIDDRFSLEVPFFEASAFYHLQQAIEDIHAEVYSLLLDTLVDKQRQEFLLDSFNNIPVIKKMFKWMIDCTNSSAGLPERLLRTACVEGIFFVGAFVIIYWFSNRGLMPGLAQSNEFIARDELLHTEFGLEVYNTVRSDQKLAPEDVQEIFKSAVDIACEFMDDAMPENLLGMNAQLMRTHIESVADDLLAIIHVPKVYNSKTPFAYMEQLKIQNKTNFFERRVTEYSKSTTLANAYDIADDF